jgi:hypothetical protein
MSHNLIIFAALIYALHNYYSKDFQFWMQGKKYFCWNHICNKLRLCLILTELDVLQLQMKYFLRKLSDWLITVGWDYVSELRPPTGPLFIPEWYVNLKSNGDDDAGWGKLLTPPLGLSGSPTSTDIWGKKEEWTTEWEFCLSVPEITSREL